jgi:aspartyl-tRNA(Asn)/glutamyl-tRNA(Gln) amidotransferase subunit B
MGVQPKIGLEIHGYIDVPSQVKLFCNCSLVPAEPNENICPICTGQPGSKPMRPNKEALDAILKIALFLNCQLNTELLWQRKHYSWPDLPNGYQKTMSGAYSKPVGLNGNFLGIGIEEIHLEEDPARWDPVSGGVDYNRSGFPLVEIVTKPDFTSSAQVREWIENLMVALSYVKAVRRDLGVKCDVNVSIAPHFIRTEVKNVNSFSAIVDAIEYEIKRQQTEEPKQQTRAWDESSGTTKFMRSKETAQDYQFIPDPDLPVIHVTNELVEPLKIALPDRPDQKQAKFEALKVPGDVAQKLAANLLFASEAEKDMHALKNVPAEFVANRYNNEIRGILAIEQKDAEHLLVMDTVLRQLLIEKFADRTLSNIKFKELLSDLVHGDVDLIRKSVADTAASKPDDEALIAYVKEAILARPEAAVDARAGKEKAINAIVGYVMAKTKGGADAAVIQKLVREHL